MKTSTSPKQSKRTAKHRPGRSDSDHMNQATADEFEREGMGIAPKE